MNQLASIALNFLLLSLVTIGGVTSVLPEVHRVAVDVHHWVTDAQFTDLFALSQAAPGPNMLIVTLIGWQAAGLAGALVATAATCAPSCLLTYFASRAWQRFRGTAWRRAVESGLAPITIGLVLATGYVLARGSYTGWPSAAVTAATAVIFVTTRLSPLWLFVAAGLLGLAGVV